ncbi:MAG: hypothetical protein SFZ03_10430 [Candidatus Melainabacteria bacterium]|nr:hypothetical protein [Candidatus Melainabacteria bacterium]
MSFQAQGMAPLSPSANPLPGTGVPPLPNAMLANGILGGGSSASLQGFQQYRFDYFQKLQTRPPLIANSLPEQLDLALHWRRTAQWKPLLLQNLEGSNETAFGRLRMARRIYNSLDRADRGVFQRLLANGTLTNTQSEEGHSALYYLYAILSTRRATGLNNKTVLAETIEILDRPYSISQRFDPLNPTVGRLMQWQQQALMPGNRSGEFAPTQPITPEAIDITRSNLCVPSSQTSREAAEMPADFVRKVNEATSPLKAYFEKASFSEISPEDPQESTVYQVLRQNNYDFFRSGPTDVTVICRVPDSAILRCMNDSMVKRPENDKNGVATLYELALAYNAARKGYHPSTDKRDALDLAMVTIQNMSSVSDVQKQAFFTVYNMGGAPQTIRNTCLQMLQTMPNIRPDERTQVIESLLFENEGLTEMEKTLMERINVDGYSMASVNLQFVANKANPAPDEITNTYLFGYWRSFENTTKDILDALSMGRSVIIGITAAHPDVAGWIPPGWGHELRIVNAFVDPKDAELKLVMFDSDDENPNLVVRTAREIIPRVHHMGLPYEVASRVQQDIDQMMATGQYLIPDETDAQHFDPVAVLQEAPPLEAFPTVSVQGPAVPLNPQTLQPYSVGPLQDYYTNPEQFYALMAQQRETAPSVAPQQAATTPNTTTPQPYIGPDGNAYYPVSQVVPGLQTQPGTTTSQMNQLPPGFTPWQAVSPELVQPSASNPVAP